MAAYTGVCLAGYGVSLFINSITGDLVGPSSQLVSVFLLSAGRAFALLAVLPALWAMGLRPKREATASDPQPRYRVAYGWQLAVPCVVSIVASGTFLAYFQLTSGSSGAVAVLTPMVRGSQASNRL
jgi:hypothetical protein